MATTKTASTDPAAINRTLETVQKLYIDLLKAQADKQNAQAALTKELTLAASTNAAHDRRIYELSKQALELEAQVNISLNTQQQLTTQVDTTTAAAEEAQEQLTTITKVRTELQQTYTDEMAT